MGVARRERRWATSQVLSTFRFSSATSQEQTMHPANTLKTSWNTHTMAKSHAAMQAMMKQLKKRVPSTPRDVPRTIFMLAQSILD
jgi:type II secretory pathway component GspD/PulD (secretin)